MERLSSVRHFCRWLGEGMSSSPNPNYKPQTQTVVEQILLLRTHITPFKWHHLNPDIIHNCIICTEMVPVSLCAGTLQILTFSGEKILRWRKVKVKIRLLHIYPEDFRANVMKRKLISFCLLQAKRVIALKWSDIWTLILDNGLRRNHKS